MKITKPNEFHHNSNSISLFRNLFEPYLRKVFFNTKSIEMEILAFVPWVLMSACWKLKRVMKIEHKETKTKIFGGDLRKIKRKKLEMKMRALLSKNCERGE